jgi:MarR family transcriptional regulator, organic hydroperoxide resistance regulator
MPKVDPAKIWSLNYRLLMAVIASVTPDIAALGLEIKELFLLAELDEHPYPAELSACLSMPKPTVSVNVKRMEAAGFVKREIDATDLRRHKLLLTASGRKAMTQGMARLSDAFGERLSRLSVREQIELRSALEKLS